MSIGHFIFCELSQIAQWTPPEGTIEMLGQKYLIFDDFWLTNHDNYGQRERVYQTAAATMEWDRPY